MLCSEAPNHGEIWWYETPDHTARPHLVLTRDEAIPVLTALLAIPATRTVRGIPTEVPLDESDGMPVACVLTIDNLTTVQRSLLTRRITVLTPERMRQVCAALAFATAC
ncbi:type II toxin-antitoxin system PemK/MazF family toxin [soil metagenome]